MSFPVEVKPDLFVWARERSRRPLEYLQKRFPKLVSWERGEGNPSFRKLEEFANATYTPIGYFFLSEPPEDTLPLSDFRTVGSVAISSPSANLLETIYICEQRQAWYREFAIRDGQEPLRFIGALKPHTDTRVAAAVIRETVRFDLDERKTYPSWEFALSGLIDQIEHAGILVMVSGIVGGNTHRPLDVDEFRGFALADEYAPLIFLNGVDAKSAQIFSLAHELVHLWMGQSAVSDASVASRSAIAIERWCNDVAAELLVPIDAIRNDYDPSNDLFRELSRLAKRYRVSSLVMLRRVLDAGYISRDEFDDAYKTEVARSAKKKADGGGNFYNNLQVRASKRFTRAIVGDTLEGGTLYGDAFQLLNVQSASAFDKLSQRMGVIQ